MTVTPRLPDDSVNVSDTHPLAEAGTLVAGVSLIFIVVTLVAVFAIDILLRLVSPATEARWLSNLSPELQIEDTAEQRDLEALLRRLERHWETDYDFRIAIDPMPEPNAMALPGGWIVVTRGLLDQVESENELAFVIGHELGHFAGRDHIRQLGRLTALSLVFSVAGSGGESVGLQMTDLTLRGFSRDQEAAADRFGLEILYREYGHVADAGRFFERIDDRQDNALARYTDTHPVPADRIDSLRELAVQQGWPQSGPTSPWPAPAAP